MIWTPRTTVAAIIPRGDLFLCVEEAPNGAAVLNQPAGHLEDGESLQQAVVREVLEETGLAFRPLGLVGIYRYRIASPIAGPDDATLTYLRYCFHGQAEIDPNAPPRDADILALHWLSLEQLRSSPLPLRSPMVLACVADYLNGRHYPLEILHDLA
ncbi:MAG: NUDIX hydrolase [Gammaproteobacteria bacterium]|nr:NUDIX hydrolase [Gammaproteobacteria bacterium]